MSNINKFLINILAARYGKDVRQSIHDAIVEIDKVADTAQNSATQMANKASNHESASKTYATNASLSETNAKTYAENAKKSAEEAISTTPEGYNALVERVGLMDVKTATDTTLRNSKAGGIRVIGIDGNSIQNGEPTPDNPQEIVSFGECVEMMQGWYNGTTGEKVDNGSPNMIRNKQSIPCKAGDTIKIILENTQDWVDLYYYGGSGYKSYTRLTNLVENEFVVPSGATYFNIGFGNANGITPQTVGKITLTVNGKYVVPIKTRGKNIVKSCGTVNREISDYNSIVADVIAHIEKGKTYTVSVTLNASKETSVYWNDSNGVMSYSAIPVSIGTNRYSYTFVANNDYKITNGVFMSKSATGDKVTIIASKFQIEEGSVATEYAPYTEHTEYIYLNEPPRKVGDIADRIVEKDGLFGVGRFINYDIYKHVDEVSTSYLLAYIMVTRNHFMECGWNKSATAKCNMLKVTNYNYLRSISNNNFATVSTNGDNWSYALRIGGLENTVEAYNAFLAENPIVFMSVKTTPTFEPLDTESQKALRRLLSYDDDVTYIDFDSTIPPSKIEVEYGTSKVGALSLENANLREILSLNVEEEINKLSLNVEKETNNIHKILNSIGNEYYSDELLTTSIKAGEILDILTIDTVTEDVLKGKYMVYVQISGYSGTQGSGEIRLFAGTSDIKGCYSVPFQNVGTDLRFNAYISCIVEIKVRYDPVKVKMNTTTDQRITGGHILLVKIA